VVITDTVILQKNKRILGSEGSWVMTTYLSGKDRWKGK